MKLKVFASLAEDINSGWVWLPESIVEDRNTIKLKNKQSGKTVYCEALPIGKNFLSRYSEKGRANIEQPESAIVINEWYRKRLGEIKAQREYDLDIKITSNPYSKLRACLQHPQIVVRMASILAIISVILGFISIIPLKYLLRKLLNFVI